MILIAMTNDERVRLSLLLKELRGDDSIRSFCLKVDIKSAAWRAWEAMDSEPSLENVEKIASLKGWTITEMISYLRTGDEKKPPYSPNDLLEYGKALPLEQRVSLARQLLEV